MKTIEYNIMVNRAGTQAWIEKRIKEPNTRKPSHVWTTLDTEKDAIMALSAVEYDIKEFGQLNTLRQRSIAVLYQGGDKMLYNDYACSFPAGYDNEIGYEYVIKPGGIE